MKSESPANPSVSDDLSTRLFGNMVMQYASMALMFMGQAPHPETGKTVKDLEAAQMFISQLEMLQAKTKGNLTPQEEAILKQSLMTLRMAFVESVEGGAKGTDAGQSAQGPPLSEAAPAEATPAAASEPPPAAPEDADERKKFVKKY